jgi:hypothetical protein
MTQRHSHQTGTGNQKQTGFPLMCRHRHVSSVFVIRQRQSDQVFQTW